MLWNLASNVLSLAELADRFQVAPLRSHCERYLKNCVEIPVMERFLFADAHSMKGLMVI